MGCGASIPAVLAPQQPPTETYLFGTATGGGEATFTLPEYEKSKPGSVLPLSLDGNPIAQIDGRSLDIYKKLPGKPTRYPGTAEKLAHLTPVKGADGKLVALIQPIPLIRPSQTACFECSSNILSTVPRVEGLTPVMEHDGVALYPWATVSPMMSWMSQYSTDIRLATPGGFERFATIGFVSSCGNTQTYGGVLKLADGAVVAKFSRAKGVTSYTAAAGVDAGLFVAAHVASVKITRDSIIAGGG